MKKKYNLYNWWITLFSKKETDSKELPLWIYNQFSYDNGVIKSKED